MDIGRSSNHSGGLSSSSHHSNHSNQSSSLSSPPPKKGANKNSSNHGKINPNNSAAQAAASLALLLREDQLITQYELHVSSKTEEHAFSYAAALLENEEDEEEDPASSSSSHHQQVTKRAMEALAEVNRKLALVESLAERVSRTSPEHVAGALLRLHGHSVPSSSSSSLSTTTTATTSTSYSSDDDDDNLLPSAKTTTTLSSIRERSDRLRRQGELLEGVAKRVETSLQRGLKRMEIATSKLSRVLLLSSTLKMILRLHFESTKLSGYDLEDLRDLTRAASSVAIIEELLSSPELAKTNQTNSQINVVENIRPNAEKIALAVRKAASTLLEQHNTKTLSSSTSSSSFSASLSSASSTVVQLSATLQVYYHLGELPQATWKAVDHALQRADEISAEFWNPNNLVKLMETATMEAKQALQHGSGTTAGGGTENEEHHASSALPKKNVSNQKQRALKMKIKELRTQAANQWAQGITDAAISVWNLHRVLCRKSDPVTRRIFVHVVSSAPIPEKYRRAANPTTTTNRKHANKKSSSPTTTNEEEFSIFSIFWNTLCNDILAKRLQKILSYDKGRLITDIAALYPSVRASSLNMMGFLQDIMQAGVSSLSDDILSSSSTTTTLGAGPYYSGGSTSATPAATGGSGILGGSAALDDTFLGCWTTTTTTTTTTTIVSASMPLQQNDGTFHTAAAARQGALGGISADTWTRTDNNNMAITTAAVGTTTDISSSGGNMSLSAIFQSTEWKTLEGSSSSSSTTDHGGNDEGRAGSEGMHTSISKFSTTVVEEGGGLSALQQAFLHQLKNRLCEPIQYMFPENNNAVAASHVEDVNTMNSAGAGSNEVVNLPLLPSRFDVQKFDENIRNELSLADPREGGGEFTIVKMICDVIVLMVIQFCNQAKNVLTNPTEDNCLCIDGTATQAMNHDIKVTKILYLLTKYVRDAPEKTFIEPYRPATTPQHEETAHICQAALDPALWEIEKMVNGILSPLCRALNRRVASAMARIHLGVYNENASSMEGSGEGEGGTSAASFVQKHLSHLFEEIATNHLSKMPVEYSTMVASSVTSFAIYTYVSNVFLVRPLGGETAKLHITQDLADIEMLLEQFLSKSGSSLSLSRGSNAKAYAELRAVRQMLFWNGLNKDNSYNESASSIAKNILRESWVKDIRPSTIFHFLISSFGPSLLSSPYHIKRMKAEDYVSTLVHYDGNYEDGEASAWMTIMTCCDTYQQRESVGVVGAAGTHKTNDGDPRISGILMMLGPELLRRRVRQ